MRPSNRDWLAEWQDARSSAPPLATHVKTVKSVKTGIGGDPTGPFDTFGAFGAPDAAREREELDPQSPDSAEAFDAAGLGAEIPAPSPEHHRVQIGTLDPDAFEERAAIIAEGAKVRPAWAEEFARLCVAPRPSRISAKEWQRIIDDGGAFLDCWGSKADELGWGPLDCFGIIQSLDGSNRPLPEIGQRTGLVLLIGGGEVVSIAEDRATIRMPSGSTLTYLRRPVLGSVAVWALIEDHRKAG